MKKPSNGPPKPPPAWVAGDRLPLYTPGGTPPSWRLAILAAVALVTVAVYLARDLVGSRGQALAGVACFIGLACAASTNLRAVRWRTVGIGLGLQVLLGAVMLLAPGVSKAVGVVANNVAGFLDFAQEGAKFVFGNLADKKFLEEKAGFGAGGGFVFAFAALPPILFVSAFFSMLYYFGVLQLVVGAMARVMRSTMGVSGAESLLAAANVFMGQTEAPLIVKPYVKRMTRSELLALMVGGMATVSGGMMAVYLQIGADATAILVTSVMAAPAGLYMAKILVPELGKPETSEFVQVKGGKKRRTNLLDAIASGTSDGLSLALNVAAMLIVFVSLVAMLNAAIGLAVSGLNWAFGLQIGVWTLQRLIGYLFWPLAFLMGVTGPDVPHVAGLLGMKLVVNELFGFIELSKIKATMDPRSVVLSNFALTGFANFASIGILIGGMGAMAPRRRGQLARLGLLALLGGTLATIINAAIAAVLLPE